MIAWRFVALQTLRGTAAAMAVLVGFVLLAGGVEGAIRTSLPVLPRLAPLAVAAGAGVAVAIAQARGERAALEALGLHPARLGALAATVGLGWGAFWLVAHLALPARADLPRWAWSGDGVADVERGVTVVRTADGLQTRPLQPGSALLDAQGLETASLGVLASSPLPAAQGAFYGRFARVLACGLLAALAWWPAGWTPVRSAWVSSLWGILWLGTEAVWQQSAARGDVGPAWAAAAPLVVIALVAGTAHGPFATYATRRAASIPRR